MSDNLPDFDQATAQPGAGSAIEVNDDTPAADYPALPALPDLTVCEGLHIQHMSGVCLRAMQAFVDSDRIDLAKDASAKVTALYNEMKRRFVHREQQLKEQSDAVLAANAVPAGAVLQ